MANSTFNGPVRSQNGFQSVSVNATSGAVTTTATLGTATSVTTLAVSGNSTLSGSANVLVIPTTDPGVAGAIWFDTPDLKISTGA